MGQLDKAREVWCAKRRSETNEQRFERYVIRQKTGCWGWKGSPNSKGYGQFSWRDKPGGSTHYIGAHVASYRLFIGPVPKGELVRHDCDIRYCVNPAHLLSGTQQDNMDDCVRRRRIAHGEKQHLAKMTESKVRRLRGLYVQGATQMSLAARFGIAQPTVSQIIRRISWKHT